MHFDILLGVSDSHNIPPKDFDCTFFLININNAQQEVN